jgi:DNA-binding response OmpR family regulator
MAVEQCQVLIVEPDQGVSAKIAVTLEGAGFKTTVVGDVRDGLRKLHESYPDLVIIAEDLPLVNGGEAVLRFRQASYVPILVLGSANQPIEVLELGADAYINQPLKLRELIPRVRSMLRRKSKDNISPSGIPESKGKVASVAGSRDRLTPTEFRLASCLLHNEDRMLSYQQIIDEVWGSKPVRLDTLHFYARSLRRKLTNGHILGFRGVGYCFSKKTNHLDNSKGVMLIENRRGRSKKSLSKREEG